MKSWMLRAALILAGVVLAAAIFAVARPSADTSNASGDVWTCSMHPQIRLPKPGPCPICGMRLIPLSQLKTEQALTEERANVETELVEYRDLSKEIRTVGKLDYNERRVKEITARIAGRIDRVYADFTGIEVKPKDHLVDIYSPTLFATQAELLRALEAIDGASGDRRFAKSQVESARTKLQLLGVLPEQIAELEKNRKEHTHLTVYAPIGGTIVEKKIREGMYVEEGDSLYRIAELDPIWLYLDIYEADLGSVRYGQPVDVTVEAYPGEVFPGTIVFIEPFLDDQTRTVKVRVNLKNEDRRLKPAMYASATIRVRLRADGTPEPTGLEGKYLCPMHPEIVRDDPGRCPVCDMELEQVPGHPVANAPVHEHSSSGDHTSQPGRPLAIRASAVLDTGRRQIAYRKNKQGAFELVDVKLGPRADATDAKGQAISYYPVIDGLAEGDEVVIRGGFMLDSQRQIEGMPSLLYADGQSSVNLHAGHGGHEGHTSGAPSKSKPASTPSHQH